MFHLKILSHMFLAILLIGILSISAFSDENSWSTNGPYGGSVKTIAIHPFNRQIIYLGTIQNGMYKTTDSGETWTHLEAEDVHPTMRVITIHPLGPDTMYAATAQGMYKSTNAGVDWNMLYPPTAPENEIRALVIHPVEPNILFAGGIFVDWRSTDGGQTWDRLEIPLGIGLEDIDIDPINTDIIYLICGSATLIGLGVWKSYDKGETWYNIHNNLDSTGYLIDIEIDPFDTDVLYLSKLNAEPPTPNDSTCLYKSTDGGQTWFDNTPEGLTRPYIKTIRVSPFNHNTVFICTSQDGVLKSTDGGMHWQAINEGLKVRGTATLEIDTTNGEIYLGTYDDGIYKSTDEGENWQKISYNISASVCMDIAISNHQPSIAYVTSLNGLHCSTDNGQSWNYVDVGFPYIHGPHAVVLDEHMPGYIYTATFHKTRKPLPLYPTGFYRSTDSGISWDFFNDGLPGNINYVDMAISYVDEEERIFLSSSQGLYYSDDVGETWAICSDGLPTDYWFDIVEVAPCNNKIIGVGGDFNQFFISRNRGENWILAGRLPAPDDLYITDIEFHPFDPEHIFAISYFEGLFESTDGGMNWVNINNNIPWDNHIILWGIAINPLNPLNMFVSSNHIGVCQTHDGGQTWELLNNGLDTTCAPGNIKFVPDDTASLFFASYTRSVWGITRTATEITCNKNILSDNFGLHNYPNPFNISTMIRYNLPKNSDVRIEIYDLLGRCVETLISQVQKSGINTVIWNAEDIPSGVYIYKLQAGDYSQSKKCILLK